MKLYELWFRLVYWKLIEERQFTAALRPGNRCFPAPKGTTVGEPALVRIIRLPGSEIQDTQPVFESVRDLKVRITDIKVKNFGDLTGFDLRDCSPDCRSKEMARYHLGLIYNRVFNDDDVVSIISFEYL